MIPSDDTLMAAIRERDPDAFEALDTRYRCALARHLLGMVRDPGASDDLLQEALLRVWIHADQWGGHGTVRAWLFRIATNLALNHLRTVRRRRELPLATVEQASRDEAETPEEPPILCDTSAYPERQAMHSERSARLSELVGSLPPEKREVVTLAYDEDLCVREVAERLGIPEGTAKSRLHYARKWLAERWMAYEEEGEEWQ